MAVILTLVAPRVLPDNETNTATHSILSPDTSLVIIT